MNDNSRHTTPLKVASICQPDIISIELGESLARALELMVAYHVGSVVVEELGLAQGVLTRRQAIGMALSDQGDVAITREALQPIPKVNADLELGELGLELISKNVNHAMVYSAAGERLGIVSQSDIVNHQGLEHDLFLKPLQEVTHYEVLRLSKHCSFRKAMERMHGVNYSAVLVGEEESGWQIMTETDVVRFLRAGVDPDSALEDLELPRLICVDSDMSLFNVRSYFKRHEFRHIGVRDASGKVVGLASYADILRSVEMDYVYRLRELLNDHSRALKQSQHDLRLIEKVINASREGVVITDADGCIQSVNPAFTLITGYEAWEALGNNPSMLSSGRHDKQFYSELWQTLVEDGSWQGEIWNRRKDGSVYPEWLSITAIENDQGLVCQYAAIFHDLTELKRSQARMQQLSWFDAVTGLANRRLFEDRLQLAYNYSREQGQMMALLALDIDLFKQINDRFGHKGGDLLLQQVAERIGATLGDRGTAARPAGDEFNIILTEVADTSELTAFLDELTRVLSMPFWLERDEVRVMVSIGVAVAPGDAGSGEALIRCAEIALQHSKEQGRNSICFFSPAQHEATLSRYRIAGLLQQALDNDEFHMVYQPQIEVDSGKLIGVEALIRWYSPQLGQVSPEVFIPVAEDAGLIEAVGYWALEQSIAETMKWLEKGLELKISVNFSARQFQRGEVASRLLALLNKYQLPAELFVVELTETCFVHSAEATECELVRLREHGVRIAIDDFGTGFSSLSYIRNMSLDMIKIDRSFISQINAENSGGRLVQAMIDMSHAMELEVVAEGVESAQDLAVLKQLGCDMAQGYHIARPMTASDLEGWAMSYEPGQASG
ncbi:EAL domain-containing protein [Marinobacterium sediminicola]|uniref:PAS domain S-box-containing protein/diguanylate cyclase (GGDEF) domain-containing protein n=1 Tax=Marinobacterium sediminicola TaxID=518898 RepID=A0ABY1RX01_9GAMM|nr:EAL domain-containing protein [Marinobacterium sediminicola]ULG67932.1 EAL domain-containing protein [Marinobacterium sediminicola]SMR71335.1 PAS domain S-box-containing protein/diguanylate cyclase (GGDEF) domain-containing protein [Marinobacterium sediminicola]